MAAALRGRLAQPDTPRPEVACEPATQLADRTTPDDEDGSPGHVAGEQHGPQCRGGWLYPGGLDSTHLIRQGVQGLRGDRHLRRQRAVRLEADGPLERRGDAVVQAPRETRLANAARVAVRVDADALADAPAGHVASNASDPANRLVPHDESAEVDLRGLGGVQVTSADAAQVYVDEHLIFAGCRRRSALEADTAIGPEHHRCHLSRSGSGSARRHEAPACR